MIIEQSRINRTPLPDSLLNAPILLPGLEFYYRAFLDLSTCRSMGMAEGPVPWDSLVRYAEVHGIRGDDFEHFSTLMRALDAEYIKYRVRKMKRS